MKISKRTGRKIRKSREKIGESEPRSNYLLILSYDGSGFQGWQVQQGEGRTVQGVLQRVAAAVFKQDIKIDGSGRTDAGVHATGQAASFTMRGTMPAEKVMHVLNHSLPGDIRVMSAEVKPPEFHARYSAEGKTYLYRILNTGTADVFRTRYFHYVEKVLDIEKMRQAAESFCGTHDFANYSASNHGKKTTVRTIHDIEIRTGKYFGQPLVELRFRGNGFLWKMVRMMVQTLIDVGIGKMEPSEIPDLLGNPRRIKEAAPSCGLYLSSVEYPPDVGFRFDSAE